MDPETLRQKLMSRIDALLGRTLLVWGDDRNLLAGLRGYVAQMPAEELKKLSTFLVTHGVS